MAAAMSDRPDPDLTPEDIEAQKAPDNAANEIAVSRKKKETNLRKKRELEAMSDLLATVNGRLLLRTILFHWCGVDSEVVNAAYDANGLHWKMGARSAGMLIKAHCIAANREQFIRLMTEEIYGETL